MRHGPGHHGEQGTADDGERSEDGRGDGRLRVGQETEGVRESFSFHMAVPFVRASGRCSPPSGKTLCEHWLVADNNSNCRR